MDHRERTHEELIAELKLTRAQLKLAETRVCELELQAAQGAALNSDELNQKMDRVSKRFDALEKKIDSIDSTEPTGRGSGKLSGRENGKVRGFPDIPPGYPIPGVVIIDNPNDREGEYTVSPYYFPPGMPKF